MRLLTPIVAARPRNIQNVDGVPRHAAGLVKQIIYSRADDVGLVTHPGVSRSPQGEVLHMPLGANPVHDADRSHGCGWRKGEASQRAVRVARMRGWATLATFADKLSSLRATCADRSLMLFG